jgi:hypothetical protein
VNNEAEKIHDLQARQIEALKEIAASIESLRGELKNTNQLIEWVAQNGVKRRSIERWKLLLGAALLLRLTLMPLMMMWSGGKRGERRSMMASKRQRFARVSSS